MTPVSLKSHRSQPKPKLVPVRRMRLKLSGLLQGVGFRPFIFGLAEAHSLKGWVQNTREGIAIEIEGSEKSLGDFLNSLKENPPPHSKIDEIETCLLPSINYSTFIIKESDPSGTGNSQLIPDIATCPDCVGEIFDSSDPRYLYPFTNCTKCGPRYTVTESIPFDRACTSMKQFSMCSLCEWEYTDPENRRFHAQTNCCPECGPQLKIINSAGESLGDKHKALQMAVEFLIQGKVIAVKGIGGFHLMAQATTDAAVLLLRKRKHRDEKPFAVLYPSMDAIQNDCEVSSHEEELLKSFQGPIVLLKRKGDPVISKQVAPENPYLGVMLPSNPLHHVLSHFMDTPIVCTSGNLSEEKICTNEQEAIKTLGGIADFFLTHDRPILRHADDSITRVLLGHTQVLRRARGYSPTPIACNGGLKKGLALGGHNKNTIAWMEGNKVIVSPHFGDLEAASTRAAFTATVNSTLKTISSPVEFIAHDAHPDYVSTLHASTLKAPTIPIQHHVAHVFSCMEDNQLQPPFLALGWDGSGFGLDNTIWGGEFFHVTEKQIKRFGSFKTFKLPGGSQAVKEPRRSALGVLYEILGGESIHHPLIQRAFEPRELKNLSSLLKNNLNCPITSSCGRLFDAVASLSDLRQVVSYEGQSAMLLEFASGTPSSKKMYPIKILDGKYTPKNRFAPRVVIDWSGMMEELLEDCTSGVPPGVVSGKFHNTLAEAVVLVAKQAEEDNVLLTGGCFQNRVLTELAVEKLRESGFNPYWQRGFPPNDGGLSLGQLVAASRPDKGML
ncbi:MAG: carbamoyltransferase HypF [Candidatus Nitronauta litoralis]|uniref:Carbamoyltransferase n=1 Tax=Candidatus Nitronauta litoralis TaxID=2705533 RepID=A0A7T0BV58_9BACT|nr:MAG: carbamoyltransferase HypF [Candidatus Nitronauta litoralis]